MNPKPPKLKTLNRVQRSLTFLNSHSKCIYVDVANNNSDVVVVVDSDIDILVHIKCPVTYSKTYYLIITYSRKEDFAIPKLISNCIC